MNFDFLPYKLNSTIKFLDDNLIFEGEDNGVSHYKVVTPPVSEILEIPISGIALYFYRGRLITAYYRLNKHYKDWELIVTRFEAYLARDAMCWEEDEGNLYNWQKGNQFLGILADQKNDSMMIYHTFKRYNVFEDG
ncbi:hypothetical protein [Niabella hirudinis]|uniref:hypothetical protein n=1 Tax=Niabella hirudinis TaxID=1285929 RepID=UPI003EB7A181